MQKKLLGLAVASVLAAPGLALAQSSVEVYGMVNMSFNRFKFEPATGPSVTKLDVANHASNYGLRGRESLGGGLTAWFQIEQNAPLERSNNVAITPASRNSAVGIQGGFGNVFIGQWTTPWADLDALWGVGTAGGWGPVTSIIGRRETTGTAPNANCVNGHLSGGQTFGSAVCDAVEAAGGVGHAFWRRVSQSVFYQSPVFGGAQVKVAYQTNEGKATQGATVTAIDPSLWSASIAWTGMGGRARVGFAIDRHEEFSSVGEVDTGWAVKGGYNLGVVNLGAAYERTEYAMPGAGMVYSGQDCKSTQWGLAASVPVGAGSIKASYAKAKAMESACVGANVGSAKTYNIGYEHRFSKRTSTAVGFAKVDNEDRAGFTWTGVPPNEGGASSFGPGNNGDVSTIFVNVTHRF
jgi:predicted porin